MTGTTYNSVCFTTGGFHQSQDRYLISNLKLAVGAPDTRNKLITEGRFSTSGILFDSGSDRIKPESYGVLKDIATVLKENPAVKVKIIGHTDSDGKTPPTWTSPNDVHYPSARRLPANFPSRLPG